MRTSRTGFTIIELVVVLAIIGVLLAIGLPSFASLRRNVALSSTVDEIVAALRLAQANAMSSQGGAAQGVYFTASQYCRFSGTTWVSCQADTTYPLGGYGLSISGAPVSVVFQHLTGATTAQSIVVGITSGPQKTIQLDATGKIAVQ